MCVSTAGKLGSRRSGIVDYDINLHHHRRSVLLTGGFARARGLRKGAVGLFFCGSRRALDSADLLGSMVFMVAKK
jgi:hypothetical protein